MDSIAWEMDRTFWKRDAVELYNDLFFKVNIENEALNELISWFGVEPSTQKSKPSKSKKKVSDSISRLGL